MLYEDNSLLPIGECSYSAGELGKIPSMIMRLPGQGTSPSCRPQPPSCSLFAHCHPICSLMPQRHSRATRAAHGELGLLHRPICILHRGERDEVLDLPSQSTC